MFTINRRAVVLAAGLAMLLCELAVPALQASEDSEIRIWGGGGANALASNPTNWVGGVVPVAGDGIVLNSTAVKDMTWDLNISVYNWVQTNYSGTVTFATLYPGQGDFTNFVVQSDVVISNGVWTHTANSGGDIEKNRLAVTVGGNFVLGPNGKINLDGKGYAQAKGPGAGNASSTTGGRSAGHGGAGANNRATSGTYGSIARPVNLGSGAYSPGGGALVLIATGDAIIDGEISARGVNTAANNNYCAGSGGSILIAAATVIGVGTIDAGVNNTRQSYYGSGGGRVALVAAEGCDFAGLTLMAWPNTPTGVSKGSAGTIYLETPTSKRLIIDQNNIVAASGSGTELPAKRATFDVDPAIGGEIADVTLIVTNGGYAGLTRDLRVGDVAWVGGTLALNSWTLYNVASEPVGAFPGDYGNGTIKKDGVCHTFTDGQTLTRDGRLLWGDSNVTWRAVSVVRGGVGGVTAIDGGAAEGYFAHEDTVSFGATANQGYDFIQWDGDVPDGVTSSDNPFTAPSLVGNHTLRAWFRDQSQSLSTNTWSGAGSSDWFDARNWNLFTRPVANQTVVIPDGATVSLTNATPALQAFIMNGGTLTFSNWATKLQAGEVVLNSGTITHPVQSAQAVDGEGNWVPDNRVWVVCDTMKIASGAQINVDAKGYLGGQVDFNGSGPGFGKADGTFAGSGGYGGAGHTGYSGNNAGATYGLAAEPWQPGSGGGGGTSQYNGVGGNGGGAVLLQVAQSLEINGVISANGGSWVPRGGGGSGGGIWLNCGTFSGTNGVVRANGANLVNNGAGGGGGRIAVHVTDQQGQASLPKHKVTFTASSGSGLTTSQTQFNYRAYLGTIWLSDNVLLDNMWLPHSGVTYVTNCVTWSVENMVVDGGWMTLYGRPDFKLTVTNKLTINGSDTIFILREGSVESHDVVITNGASFYQGFLNVQRQEPAVAIPEMRVTNNLVIATNSTFGIYSAATNAVTVSEYGSLVDVGEDFYIAAGGKFFPYSANVNGASPLLRMKRLTIAAGGVINAGGLGFAGAPATQRPGYGPGGGGNSGNNNSGGGGGYGGAGGKGANNGTGGAVYGVAETPVWPGSGGGSGYGGAAAGGGLVRVAALESINLQGTISANGGAGNSQKGGGSGGGIYLRAPSFSTGATAVLRANGGTGGGGGGGGRIAVWYGDVWDANIKPSRLVVTADEVPVEFSELLAEATGGSAQNYVAGQLGTILFVRAKYPAGTLIVLW